MVYEKASKIGVIFRDANISLVNKRTPLYLSDVTKCSYILTEVCSDLLSNCIHMGSFFLKKNPKDDFEEKKFNERFCESSIFLHQNTQRH